MQIHKTGGSVIGIHLVKNDKSCGWGGITYWYKRQFCGYIFNLTISNDPSSTISRNLLVSDELMEWDKV